MLYRLGPAFGEGTVIPLVAGAATGTGMALRALGQRVYAGIRDEGGPGAGTSCYAEAAKNR